MIWFHIFCIIIYKYINNIINIYDCHHKLVYYPQLNYIYICIYGKNPFITCTCYIIYANTKIRERNLFIVRFLFVFANLYLRYNILYTIYI